MRKRLLLFIYSYVLSGYMFSQDIQLTQFYASPIYLNPAFTGANSDSRLATTYRNQWAALPGSFSSFIVSYDYYFHNYRSGAGIILTSDKAGSAGLGTNTAGINYAYDYKFDRYWSLSGGLRASYCYRNLDFERLLFGDQIARNASSSLQAPFPERVNFLDFSAGLLIFSAKHWAGISLNHLNKPDQAFLQEASELPVKGSFHAGTNIPLQKSGDGKISDKPYITVAGHYRFQNEFDQADIGLYYKEPSYFIGLWYRGLPGFKAYKPGYSNHDAIAILIGGCYKQLNIGYSFDFTISKLTMVSGGSHEISLNYMMYNPKKPKKHRTKIVPCPKF